MILTRDQTDVFRTSVGLEPHPRLKHHTTEGTRPAEMLCENCNASNPYGLLFCQVCHVKMKDTTFQDGALNTIITQATRTVRETISILYRAGGDAAHNYRGHRSMEGGMGKRARRHARKAQNLGYEGIADRFARDIPWRMSLLEGGHTPQTISLYIERSLEKPREINMSWRERQEKHTGRYFTYTDQPGGGHGTRPLMELLAEQKGKGKGRDRRALASSDHLSRHAGAAFDEQYQIIYPQDRRVPPPPQPPPQHPQETYYQSYHRSYNEYDRNQEWQSSTWSSNTQRPSASTWEDRTTYASRTTGYDRGTWYDNANRNDDWSQWSSSWWTGDYRS